RHGAELWHQSERVEARPALGDLLACDPVDRDSGYFHPLAGGRHAHQLAVLRALAGPAGDHQVAIGDLVVNLDAAVREGRVVHPGRALRARGTTHLTEGVLRVVVLRIRRDQLVECIQVAGVPRVVEPPG